MPDGTPIKDEYQKYREQQEKEYQDLQKKIADKHEKKLKKRENSIMSRLNFNPLIKLLVQKSLPASSLKLMKEEQKKARFDS